MKDERKKFREEYPAENQQMLTLLEKVSERMISLGEDDFEETCAISIIDINKWEWAQGVGLYGLLKYYQCIGNEKILNYLTQWFDRNIELGLPTKNVNTCAPMLTLAFLYEISGNEKYLALCEEWAQWIMNKLVRTQENGFQHIGSANTIEEAQQLTNQQLWDDTIFMVILFLAKFGVITGNKSYIDETVRQMLLHIKYLFDKKTGLWYHVWSFERQDNFSQALWGRGNSWFTSGLVDYLEITGLSDGAAMFMIDTFVSQVNALKEFQHTDGMWSTLIDQPDTYKESSATAGFAYGILKAVRQGILPQQYEQIGLKALNALINQISDNGTVENVSYGTGVYECLDVYKSIPIHPMTYGQALSILALTEGIQYIKDN